jgi:chromosome segregation ATPase
MSYCAWQKERSMSDWIPHKRGKCPVANDAYVIVRWEGEECYGPNRADSWTWHTEDAPREYMEVETISKAYLDRLRAENERLKEELKSANTIIDRLNKREAAHIKRVRKAEEEKELRERLLDIKYAEGMESKVADLRAEVASLKEDVQRAIKQRDMWDKANSEARQQLAAANGRVEMLRDAIENLRKVKGRHNTELACNRLFAALSNLNEDRAKSDV